MAGTPIGTIFAELALDDSKYKESQKRLLREATSTTLNIEKNFKNLGVKSSAEFDLMRQKIQNSFERIKNHAKVTANDIVRAEKAKNEQLKRLNEQQYGAQVSMIDKIKKNWLGMTAAVTAAYFAMQKAWNVSEQAAQYEQSRMAFSTMVRSMGKDAETEFQRIKKASAGLVDNKSLVESANKAMSLGISIDSLAGLMEIARAKARDMGTQTADAFNDIAIGIGRASPKILDNLGIIVKIGTANETLAASLGKTVEQLTDKEKQLAVTNAVLEAGKEALARYNLEQKTTKEKMDSLRATVANLNLLLGQGFIRAAAAAVGVYRTLNAASMVLSAGVWRTVQAYHSLMEIVTFGEASERHRQIAEEARRYAEMDMEAAKEYWGLAKDNFDAMIATTDELAGAMQKIPAAVAAAGESAADSADELKEAIKGAQEDFELFLKLNRDLEAQEKAAIEAGKKDFDLYLAGLRAADQIEKDRIKNIEKAEKEAKESLEGVEKFWKHTLENIHDATADTIYNIIDNWSEGFSSLFESIKNWFKRLLAEMIATAMANPIRIAIGTVMGVGAGGTALAGTGGGGGSGIFDLSGISKLFSGMGAAGWGVTNPASLNMMRQGLSGGINWANVGGYLGLAYEAYNLFKSIGEGKYLTSAGIGIGAGIGAILGGGPVGAAIGAGLGDLIGGILDSIFGLGKSEPEFTLSEINTRYSGGAVGTTKWTPGVGVSGGDWPQFEDNWDVQPTVAHTAIVKAYAKGRREIAENFNESMMAFMESLPENYLTIVEDALAGMDFTYTLPGTRWEFKDAQGVVESLLQNYADFLAGKFDEIVNVVGAAYFEQDISTSELFGKLTTEKQAQVKGLLSGGGLTGEQFQTFLEEWQELAAVMTGFEALLDPAIAQMTTYEKVTASVGDTFDNYVSVLKRAGVAVEELGDLEEMRAEVIEREIKAMQDAFHASFEEEMFLKYSGASDYEKALYKLNQEFDAYIDTAKDLGLSQEELAEIEEWRLRAVEDLAEAEAKLLEKQKQSVQEIVLAAQGFDSFAAHMKMLDERYGWSRDPSGYYGSASSGFNYQAMLNTFAKGFTIDDLKRIAEGLGIDWETIADDVGWLVDNILAMQEAAKSLGKTIEDQYYSLTMSSHDYGVYKATMSRDETLAQLRELYDQGFYSASEYNRLTSMTWTIFRETVDNLDEVNDGLQDTIREAEDASKSWGNLLKSIQSSILGLTTGTANQADVYERLALARNAITDLTGGRGIADYISGLGSESAQQEAIEDLMDLYNNYLSLAQEAYQRPSTAYQNIYDEILGAYQVMEGIAKSEHDYWEAQLDYLKRIAENTSPSGSYATVTEYVPKDGIYRLHQGEKVIPAGESAGGDVQFTLIINGSNMNPREARQEFETFLRSSRGRKLIQNVAVGR